jgi:hypothetical protein
VGKPFVRSADTSTPVSKSRADIERILVRYGCAAFSSSTDYETGVIWIGFLVKNRPEDKLASIPVKLRVDINRVAWLLAGGPASRYKLDTVWRTEWRAKAERVAWRNLTLWVDAACAAASCGIQDMGEAFFAHVVVGKNGGGSERVIDQFNERGGFLALPATTE